MGDSGVQMGECKHGNYEADCMACLRDKLGVRNNAELIAKVEELQKQNDESDDKKRRKQFVMSLEVGNIVVLVGEVVCVHYNLDTVDVDIHDGSFGGHPHRARLCTDSIAKRISHEEKVSLLAGTGVLSQ